MLYVRWGKLQSRDKNQRQEQYLSIQLSFSSWVIEEAKCLLTKCLHIKLGRKVFLCTDEAAFKKAEVICSFQCLLVRQIQPHDAVQACIKNGHHLFMEFYFPCRMNKNQVSITSMHTNVKRYSHLTLLGGITLTTRPIWFETSDLEPFQVRDFKINSNKSNIACILCSSY